MELPDALKVIIQQRIVELEQARDRLIEQANLELARLEARRDELGRLLAPPAEKPE